MRPTKVNKTSNKSSREREGRKEERKKEKKSNAVCLREASSGQNALHWPRHFRDVNIVKHAGQQGGGSAIASAQIQHPFGSVIIGKVEELPELSVRDDEHRSSSQDPEIYLFF